MSLLTVREVAQMLSVSPMTVYRMIRSGDLPAIRIGRCYRVDRRVVEAFLSAQGVDWFNDG